MSLFNNNKENARLPSQLPNIKYEYLLDINGTDEFLKVEGVRFVIGEILHLEPLIEELPTVKSLRAVHLISFLSMPSMKTVLSTCGIAFKPKLLQS